MSISLAVDAASVITVTSSAITYLQISNVVKINLETGEVERLEGFTTNEVAAAEFWAAVEVYKRK